LRSRMVKDVGISEFLLIAWGSYLLLVRFFERGGLRMKVTQPGPQFFALLEAMSRTTTIKIQGPKKFHQLGVVERMLERMRLDMQFKENVARDFLSACDAVVRKMSGD